MNTRIVECTSERLQIRTKPGLADRLLALAGATLLAGLGAIAAVSTYAFTLTCQREDTRPGPCTLSVMAIFETTTQHFNSEQMIEARVYSSSDENQRTDDAVFLLTTNGEVPIIRYATASSAEQVASQINRFIADPSQPELTITIDRRGGIYLLGLGLIVLSIVAAMSGFNTTIYTFERLPRIFRIERQPFGPRAATYSIAQIQDIATLEVSSWPKRKRVYLLLESGKRIPLEIPTNSELIAAIEPFIGRAPFPSRAY